MHYYAYGWHDYVVDVWDPQLAVASTLFLVMLFCVYRAWRGMRLDAFERNVRTLRQQPGRRFQPSRPAPAAPGGVLQISLLPLMLLSGGLAILIAQAQQPDELSRPVTWGLFVATTALYGMHAWGGRRGFGLLRNYAMAGAASASLCSMLLWLYYMGVDRWWSLYQQVPAERLTARLPQLLWWTAVGATIGAMLGAVRAHQRSNQLQLASEREPDASPDELAQAAVIPSAPGRSTRKSAVLVGCAASLLFHLSAAPQLNQVVRLRHYWLWDTSHHPSPGLTLTMTPMDRPVPQTLPAMLSVNWNGKDGNAWGKTNVLNQAVWDSRHPAQVSEPIPNETVIVLTPTRNIARGELLVENDFLTVTREAPVSAEEYIIDARSIVGTRAGVDLVAGAPLRKSAIASLASGVQSKSFIARDGAQASEQELPPEDLGSFVGEDMRVLVDRMTSLAQQPAVPPTRVSGPVAESPPIAGSSYDPMILTDPIAETGPEPAAKIPPASNEPRPSNSSPTFNLGGDVTALGMYIPDSAGPPPGYSLTTPDLVIPETEEQKLTESEVITETEPMGSIREQQLQQLPLPTPAIKTRALPTPTGSEDVYSAFRARSFVPLDAAQSPPIADGDESASPPAPSTAPVANVGGKGVQPLPAPDSGDAAAYLPTQVVRRNGQMTVARVDPVAAAAGLRVGDVILEVRIPALVSVEWALNTVEPLRMVLLVRQPGQPNRTVTINKGRGALAAEAPRNMPLNRR